MWRDLAREQDGVVARSQLLQRGWTSRHVQGMVEKGRWQRLFPGVYLTYTGPVPARARAWAALLYAGDGAALAGRCALAYWQIDRDWPASIEVAVPERRRVRAQHGLVVLRRVDLDLVTHPAAVPTRLRLEEALLDVVEGASQVDAVLGPVFRAVQTRRTTSQKLALALGRRRAHRWRPLLVEALAQTEEGVRSPLERRYVRDVHRRHLLPRASFNRRQRVDACPGPRIRSEPTARYRDVWYEEFGVLVEVDGREAHPDDVRFRDRARDNAAALTGAPTLRYGWVEIAADPCGVAAQVIAMLRLRGWTGTPRPCGPTCPVGT